MASNLNQAFMRAYAKDRGTQSPETNSHDPHAAQVAAAQNPSQIAQEAQPFRSSAPAPHFRPTAAAPRAQQSAFPVQPNQQPWNESSAAPSAHVPGVSQRNHQTPTHGPSHFSTEPEYSTEAESIASASDVWQRIDAANQSIATPHYLQPARPQQQPVAAAAPAQPFTMAAQRTSAPPAPQPSLSMPIAHPNTVSNGLPLREDAAAFETPAAAEGRRRTVADFLYAAGNIPASHLNRRAPNSVRASAAPVQTSPVESTSFPTASAPASYPVVERYSESHSAAESISVASRTSRYAPEIYPSAPAPSYETNPQIDPAQRSSRIVRLDVPPMGYGNSPGIDDYVAERNMAAEAPAAPAKSAAIVPEVQAPASPLAPATSSAAQVDYDRLRAAAAISAKEEKLRHQVHQPFNPVWEVDNLQWPNVCNRLMEQRADSMATVGAHLKSACQDGLGILAVTSAGSGEGRTTVTCCLSLLASSHGMKVAVIDLDLDHPTLCLQMNLEAEYDWRDVIFSDISLEEAAVHSINDQLTVFPLKPRAGRPAITANDRRISDLLSRMSESFDLVIVDASRVRSSGSVVMGLADANIFDAAIVVVDRRNSDTTRIEDTVRALRETGIESIGIVDNFAS